VAGDKRLVREGGRI